MTNTELIVAVSAQITALAALLVALWTGYLGRLHNRQSVRPILSSTVAFGPEDRLKGITVSNVGLGPAVIESFTVFLDKNKQAGSCGGWTTAFDTIGVKRGLFTHRWYDKGDVLAGPTRHILLGVDTQQVEDPQALLDLKEVIKRIDVRIVYSSVYEERRRLFIDGEQLGANLDGLSL